MELTDKLSVAQYLAIPNVDIRSITKVHQETRRKLQARHYRTARPRAYSSSITTSNGQPRHRMSTRN